MKKYLFIVLIIVCIAVLIGFLAIGNKAKEDKDVEKNSIANNAVSSNITNVSNNVKINNTQDITNNVVDKNEIENTVQDAIQNLTNEINSEIENKTSSDVSTPVVTEESEDSSTKEKAISLAKKEWGEDSSVYFTNEGTQDGYYKVDVRNKSDSSAVWHYKVNVDNNTVEDDF